MLQSITQNQTVRTYPQTNYGINYLQNIVMEFSKAPKIII